jgi:hypothetical protein
MHLAFNKENHYGEVGSVLGAGGGGGGGVRVLPQHSVLFEAADRLQKF